MFLQFPNLERYYHSDATGERPKQLEQTGLLILLSVYLALSSLYMVLDMSYTLLQSSFDKLNLSSPAKHLAWIEFF